MKGDRGDEKEKRDREKEQEKKISWDQDLIRKSASVRKEKVVMK